ncbi:hypothetical protein [Sphingomonas sp. DBB INV C78]|uniref:hypothetical protein n=1 Tax=Sphingomonas sp. DBB INV C78 TaxID=3349434 RepID=UPI0036D2DB05
MATDWEEPATLIDLDGTAPFIGKLGDCIRHFVAFKPHAKADARILLTRPVAREGRKTRTWVLNPDEIAALAVDLPKA